MQPLNIKRRFTLFLLSLSATKSVIACVIQGYDSGICVQPTEDVKRDMPFCGEVVDYPVCIPKYYGSVVSRWRNHTLRNKDKWVEDNFNIEWDIRKTIELNETMRESNINEYGMKGRVTKRFYAGNQAQEFEDPWLVMNDCAKAYKNFFCWSNFPRCDDEGNSLILCTSVCENYFKSCGYSKDMYRCGPSEFFNGYEEEEPLEDENGLPTIYMRSFFPGQPFRENEFLEDQETPVVVCTPSLQGSANTLKFKLSQVLFITFLTFLVMFLN